MIEFVGLRGKTYSYLTDGSSENKKAKGTKTTQATQLEKKINYVEKTEIHNRLF